MPVKRIGTQLAALAVLGGLCVAGAGCQSSATCRSHCSPCCDPCSSGKIPAVNSVAWRSSYGRVVSRPLRRQAQFVTTREPALAPSDNSCNTCSTPAAVVLRPVPITNSQAMSHGEPSSTWSPVQRVSGETVINEGGISQAVTLERPQPVALPPLRMAANEPSLRPVPIISDPGSNPKPDNTTPMPKIGNNNDRPNLPLPKEKAKDKGAGNDTQNSYPVLPKTVVTNPPHAPREFSKRALSTYIIEPPDVLVVEGTRDIVDPSQPITGPHLVRPDGTIGLGSYGSIFVAGCTIDQAKMKIIEKMLERQPKAKIQDLWEGIKVDVAAFNSKFYYVITDGGGYGETVIRVPITGNETVLDAISQIQGLPVVASKKLIWVARATPNDHQQPIILPVDWLGITQRGSAATNYQIFPGDRIYVHSDKLIRADSFLAKLLSPVERMFGITLLGATTVNAIKGNQGANQGLFP